MAGAIQPAEDGNQARTLLENHRFAKSSWIVTCPLWMAMQTQQPFAQDPTLANALTANALN
jgi:hypothetical protein